jgi:predicted ATPase/DNA-binding winged helix-turn-helix (wHTH) protein
MAVDPRTENSGIFLFGPFRLSTGERRLEKDGRSLSVGGRAFDILVVLLENAGHVVSKRELLARVWADVIVDEGSLRFHVSELRKVLGDGQSEDRYVGNVPGRGYCFVATVSREAAPAPSVSLTAAKTQKLHNLPVQLGRMVGREEAVHAICAQLANRRFVTIVGPGGIGKTTIAIAIGHKQLETFAGAIHFVDLAQLNDPALVSVALATAFGLSVHSEDPLPGLVSFLRDQRCLVILDSSEHLIDAVASIAERIFSEAQDIHILATSREPLQAEGENVYRLHPLDSPIDGTGLSAQQAMQFPAVQMFVERVSASTNQFELTDENAPAVGEICRKLDGIALAIELAASRVEAYGVEGTAALLDDNFRLLWRGRRTALARHRTLGAVLEWSYNLLTEVERTALRRLSVFVGAFTFEAGQSILLADVSFQGEMADVLSDLVAKSLVSVVGSPPHYRLLDTTRAYVRAKLSESGEEAVIARRHALYYIATLEAANALSAEVLNGAWLAAYADHVGNARAALEWSFSPQGEPEVAVALAAATAPLFLRMSLLAECHRWTGRAIETLDSAAIGTGQELELVAFHGQSLMFTKGGQAALTALERGLALAQRLGSPYQALRFLDGIRVFHIRNGAFRDALAFADQSKAVLDDPSDPASRAASDWMLTNSLHMKGDQALALTHCLAALSRMPASLRHNIVHFGYDHRIAALCNLGRILWLHGQASEASLKAKKGISEAKSIGHSFTLCISLIWAIPVFLWSGDSQNATESIDVLSLHAKKYALGPYHAVSLGFRGEHAIKCGDFATGIELLKTAVEMLRPRPYQNFFEVFAASLADCLALTGAFAEGLVIIDEAIAGDENRGGSFYTAEILRIKGNILASLQRYADAEAYLKDSRETALRQAALSWELRAVTSLAKLYAQQRNIQAALEILEPTFNRFQIDINNADISEATETLLDLKSSI